MPELPEVETVCRTLRRHVVGRRIQNMDVRQPALRWPVDVAGIAEHLVGAEVTGVRRRAKYILIDVAPLKHSPYVLAVHLGMSGIVRVVNADLAARTHDHAVFRLDDGREMRFNDPRRFGSLHGYLKANEAYEPRLMHLGVEPVGATPLSGEHLYARSRGVKRAIKIWLMDAAVVVGVGNIYASEALHRAHISPKRLAGKLTRPAASRLAEAVVATLEDAICDGGTTLRDFSDADDNVGHFGQRLRVYGRAGSACPCGGGQIIKCVQGGRSTFWCRSCQKP